METPQANLVKIMHGINSGYTGYFNRKHDRTGHLFQRRYSAVIVDKNSYLTELTRHVHLNPVRAGIVKIPEEHIWSSYPGYVSKSKQVEWIYYSRVLSQFAPDLKKAQKNYRDFVSRKMEYYSPVLFYSVGDVPYLSGYMMSLCSPLAITSFAYIAHFTPKKGDIDPNTGGVSGPFHFISRS